MLPRLTSFVSSLIRGSSLNDDVRRELQAHLAARAEDLEREGLPRAEAERRARLEFGSVQSYAEECREARGLRIVDELLGNLRYAWRSLRQAPGVTAVAICSLALGIGANTAIFSLVNAVAWRPLPVQDPARLMLLSWSAQGFPERYVSSVEGNLHEDEDTGRTVSRDFSSATVENLQAQNRVFSTLFAFADNSIPSNILIGGHSGSARLVGVSGEYFDGLGLPASVGRALHQDDDRAGAPDVAVVSWPFWQRALGGAPVVGTSLIVNGLPVTVVGVTPPDFYGLQPGRFADIYVPLRFYIEQHRRGFGYDLRDSRIWWLSAVGRLKPGVTVAQARTDLAGLLRGSLGIESSLTGADKGVPQLELSSAERGLDGLRRYMSGVLVLLMAMVGLVLAVACANVGGLLLSRGVARQHDFAMRVSLGASRSRLVRQILTESTLLGLLGGAAGLVVGRWVSELLPVVLAHGMVETFDMSPALDARVLGFTALISVVSSVVFGLVPAIQATRGGVAPALMVRSDASLRGTRTWLGTRGLVGTQIALCLSLLVAAGLLAGTLQGLQRVNLGFDHRDLIVFSVQPGLNGHAGARLTGYYERLQHRLASVPGVRGVALSLHNPIGQGTSQGTATLPGSGASGKEVSFHSHRVSEGFFKTYRIPVTAGRAFGPQDSAGAPHAVIVNRRFVRENFPDGNPVGRQFQWGKKWTGEIVGVVADTKYGDVRDEAPPTAYIPYPQNPRGCPASMVVALRVDGRASIGFPAIERAVLSVDPAVPAVAMSTEAEVLDQTLFRERTLALLSGGFGVLALALACVGLYGTLSYAVVRRTGEIGVRMALGARPSAVVRMVLRESLVIAVAGIAAGVPLAWFGGRLMSSLLFGVSPHDPWTFAGAIGVILAVTLLSGMLPARRAARVDPLVALRQE